MLLIKFTIFLFITQLIFINSQTEEEESALKAFSCITILTHKFQGQKPDPSVFSPQLLACFIKIKNEELQKILSSVISSTNPLTSKETEDLTDADYLKNITKEELVEKSKELESAIKLFNAKDKNNIINAFMNKLSDENNKSKSGLIKSFLIMAKNGLISLVKNHNRLWVYLIALIVLYFILMKIRKYLNLRRMKKLEKINNNKKKKN